MFEAKVGKKNKKNKKKTSLYAWGKSRKVSNPKDPIPVSSRGDKERARNVCPRLTTETEQSLTAMRTRGWNTEKTQGPGHRAKLRPGQ